MQLNQSNNSQKSKFFVKKSGGVVLFYSLCIYDRSPPQKSLHYIMERKKRSILHLCSMVITLSVLGCFMSESQLSIYNPTHPCMKTYLISSHVTESFQQRTIDFLLNCNELWTLENVSIPFQMYMEYHHSDDTFTYNFPYKAIQKLDQ